jgi:hypothetical protein
MIAYGADEFHSIMGLRHCHPWGVDTPEGQRLIRWALEGTKLWCDMLHSWIGHPFRVQFDLNGRAITPTPLKSEAIQWV